MSYLRSLLFLALLFAFSTESYAQKKVAIVSFYLNREVDFSLMQMFNDDSEDKIKKLTEDPEFNIRPLITDFHDYVVGEILPIAPFGIADEASVTGSKTYQALSATIDKDKTELHEPYDGYLRLGSNFKDDFLTIAEAQSADGIMLIDLTFFVRKNGLKTVIMAQVEMYVRNTAGKNAWKYIEFGLSKEGITTFSGFIVSNQDEVMPMFSEAVENLKEKVAGNFAKRSANSTKKL